MNGNTKYDLEERLIRFANSIADVCEALPDTQIGKYLGQQLIRSGCSPALNYGEAQGAESLNDFIHKMKVCLKELRESMISLKILKMRLHGRNEDSVMTAMTECNELIMIFVKSIQTAEKKRTVK